MKESWTYKKLGEVCEVLDSKRKPVTKSKRISGIYPYYGATGIQDYVDKFIFDGNYLLVGEDGAKWGTNDKTAYQIHGKCWVNNHAHILKVNDDVANTSFLEYYLVWKDLRPFITGAIVQKLTQAALVSIPIPVPPLSTQSRIVSELDLLQSVIDKQKAQLKELDNLAQAIFYDMFGDPITNTKGWEKCELNKNVEEMFLGPFGSSLKVDSYVDKGSSYCMVYEQKHAIQAKMDFEDTHYINEEKYNSLKRFTVVGGDFIMSCRGTIGRIFQLPLDAPLGIIHPSLMKIRIKNSYSPVFFKFLLTKTMEEQVTNGNCVQMAITAKELGKKHLVLPPLSLQQSFAQKVESIERQKELINQSIREAQTLFDSRMEYYFGE